MKTAVLDTIVERVKTVTENSITETKRRMFEVAGQLWNLLWELLFTLYVLIVDLVYDIVYYNKPRHYVSSPPKSDLISQSASSLHRSIIERRVKCTDVIEAYIQRIEEVNPLVNAVCFRNYDEARKEAKNVDETLDKASEDERQQLSEQKPFLGVPVTVKNNVNVKGFPTVNGWFKLKDNMAQEDADCVHRLREAGCIVLAMTNVPELCLWIETSNSTFGTTCNPYDSRRTCGGSSGGEGALLASAASVIGVGTDIAGSIRVPCMFSGLYGIKPTPFVMSSSGFHPIDRESRAFMQTPGPMCRFAEDLTPMFKAMCLPEELPKLRPALDLHDVRVFRFNGYHGWCTERLREEQKNAHEKVVSYFENELGVAVPPVEVPFQDQMYHVVAAAVQDGLEKPYCELMEGTQTLPEYFIDFFKMLMGDKNAKHALLSRQVNMNSVWMHGVPKEKLEQTISLRKRASELMSALLGDNGILVVPGWPTPAVYHDRTVWKHTGITHTAVWNALGLPAIAVPLGLSKEGLPLSVQIVGPAYSDLTLLRIAEYLDAHSNLCKRKDLFPGYVGPWLLKEKGF